jgi:hypothetical protein
MENCQLYAMLAKERRQDDLRRAEHYRQLRECEVEARTEIGQPMVALLAGSLVVAILWQMV